MTTVCEVCGEGFETTSPRARVCSQRCRHKKRAAAIKIARAQGYTARMLELRKADRVARPDVWASRDRAAHVTRRTKLREMPHATKDELDARLAEYNGMCAYCGLASHEEWDHYIPLSRGGSDTIDNLFPSCRRHNRSKGSKLPILEWMPS